MKKYYIQVTETVNHAYVIEAESEDEAISIYDSYDGEQLAELDVDGACDWDAHPWDIEEMKS